MKRIRIGNHWLGDGERCFIIAEAGSNHNGKLELARELVDVAAQAGADAVKFQLFRASRLYPKSAGASEYLKVAKPIYDIIAEMEMPYGWVPLLAQYTGRLGLEFLCSAFDEESVDSLNQYVAAHKIASYEMTHHPLVRHIARKGKPMIVSTGTAHMDEVAEAVAAIHHAGNDQIVVLQCTGSYPAPLESVNLLAINALRNRLSTLVGLSDHSRDPIVAPLGAVALGACIVEKHFTLSNDSPGPDHRFALEPAELTTMITKIRELERALGSGKKEVDPVEAELRHFARRSIFATRNIAAGERFSTENIAVLRCGKLEPGLEPRFYPTLLERRARRAIPAETSIRAQDCE